MYKLIFKILILLLMLTILIISFYYYNNIYPIQCIGNDQLNMLNSIEKEYAKEYPIGNDKFKIIHFPQYSSFFNQFNKFNKWIYMIKKNQDKIIATCCFANIFNNIYYICDLKKINNNHNVTFDFMVYAKFLSINTTFGIVMEPNNIVDKLVNKYGYIKITTLNLYQIPYKIIKNNIALFNKIFPDFFIVNGYKQFILSSDNSVLNCYHIGVTSDAKLVSIQKPIPNDIIGDNDNIMFCLKNSNKFNLILQKKLKINFINRMNIIANKNISDSEFDFNNIKTYMI